MNGGQRRKRKISVRLITRHSTVSLCGAPLFRARLREYAQGFQLQDYWHYVSILFWSSIIQKLIRKNPWAVIRAHKKNRIGAHKISSIPSLACQLLLLHGGVCIFPFIFCWTPPKRSGQAKGNRAHSILSAPILCLTVSFSVGAIE